MLQTLSSSLPARDALTALEDHIIALNNSLREQLFAKPYLVYMISKREGQQLLSLFNDLERQAFLIRALTRQPSSKQELDAHLTSLLGTISQASEDLSLEHSESLQELFDAMFLALTFRHRRMLDLFLETLLDVRATWTHAMSVVARSPI